MGVPKIFPKDFFEILKNNYFRILWSFVCVSFRSLLSQPVELTEGFLRRIDDVQESVLVHFASIQIRHRHRNGSQCRSVYQQEKSLIGMQLKASPNDLHEFPDGNMVGNQEFRFIEYRQLLLSVISFDDDRNFVGMLIPNLFDVLHSESETSSLFEGFLHDDVWIKCDGWPDGIFGRSLTVLGFADLVSQ